MSIATARAILPCVALVLALAPAASRATDLVYRPVNPAFGGDPINGSVLLNNAQAQNNKKDPEATQASSAFAQRTALQQFSDTLQRSILSRLASSASGSLFGAGGQLVPGTVETNDFRITISDTGGGTLQVITLDKVTGQSTTFQVGL